MNSRFNIHKVPPIEFSFFLEELGLTRREVDVLEWVARGKTNKEIGMILDIKPRTVAKHLANIYIKFGVTSRTAAVLHFLEKIQSRLQIPNTF